MKKVFYFLTLLLIVTASMAQQPKLMLPIGHTESYVTSASFSPDGKYIVTTSFDKTAKVWNGSGGELVIVLKGHTNAVNNASFSPDGKYIVTASWDSTAKVWDAVNGNLVETLKGHTHQLHNASFTPDGKFIVTASLDYTAKVWNALNGQLVATIKGENKGPFPIGSFSPDGKYLATRYSDGTARIWNARNGQLVRVLNAHSRSVRSVSFSNDGKFLVTSSGDSTAKIWNTENGQPLVVLKGHTGRVAGASFSPDGKYIVTTSGDSTAKIWDAVSGQLIANMKGQFSRAFFSPDGNYILSISGTRFTMSDDTDNTRVQVWDAITGEPVSGLKAYANEIWDASYSPDGKYIVTACSDNTAKVWNAINGKLVTELKGHTRDVWCVRFSADGNNIYTLLNNHISIVAGKDFDSSFITKIWNTSTGQFLANLKGDNGLYNEKHESDEHYKSSFSSARKLKVRAENSEVSVYDSATGKKLYTFIAVDSTDYLIYDKDNHYDGTLAARKLLYFMCDREIIELDQVKDQLWVPNLAERIMKGDSINAKSLDELNICGLTPEVEDSSYKPDEYCFKILPRRGGLGETVLYLNGIEVKRYKPAELKNTRDSYELKIKKAALKDLFVAGKENRLTVKAFTSDNAISSRALAITEDKSKDQTTAPNLFAVMVGVSDYKGEELDLKFPGKDATDIAAVISGSAKKLLNTDGAEHVFMYNLTTDKGHYQLPEKKSIKKVLEEIGNKATANDILLIFFAGHGVMRGPEDNKQFYFLTADASINASFGAVADVGISTSELTEWIKPANIKAQKRILIFDACNSGQAIKDFVKLGNKEQGYIAARSDEKSQEIKAIEKLNNQSGLFILSASASNLAAYEMGRYSQGLLTYSLLKAVKQQPDILNEGKYLDVSKWFNAARESVSALSKESGARQDPQIVSNTNFNIGVVDEEVMAKIVLSHEKPLFAACNFQNADENNPVDNLGLNKLIDQQLNSISSRGTDAPIVYAGTTSSAEAYTLSGRYNITGNAITIKVFIIQNKEVKQKIDFTGTKDKLDKFAELIAARAATWTEKNK